MRRSAPILTLSLLLLAACPAVEAGGVSEKPDCPKPVINIKGPCPDPCPQCPACSLRCAEIPPCACPDAYDRITPPEAPPPVPGFHRSERELCEPVVEHVPFVSSLPPSGHWFVPLGLMRLPGTRQHVAWVQRRDPSLDTWTDARWGLSAGLGYRTPKGWALSASAIYLEAPTGGASWDVRQTYPRVSNPVTETRGSRWGVMVGVEIPVGGGR